MQAITLDVVQLCASAVLEEVWLRNGRIELEQQAYLSGKHMGRVLTASVDMPGKRLKPELVASYPTTWIDAVKARFGFKHNVTQVWSEKTAVLPDVPLPADLMRGARMFTTYRATTLDLRSPGRLG